MFALAQEQIERLPFGPNPPVFPKMPDLAGVEKLLKGFQGSTELFAGHVANINLGLFLTGVWMGALTVCAVWFVVDRLRTPKQPK